MDADGTKQGFDVDMLNAVCGVVNIPVIASGGCGELPTLQSCSAGRMPTLPWRPPFSTTEKTVNQVKKELKTARRTGAHVINKGLSGAMRRRKSNRKD
jgi:cyclase